MIRMLVTLSTNNVIGIQGTIQLLWDSEVNNKFLYTNMENEILVMGHNTFKNFKRKYITATIVVLSKTEEPGLKNDVHYYNNMSDILKKYKSFLVVGGEQIYKLFLPVTDQVLISMLGVEVTNKHNIYFPMDELEENFFGVQESSILLDIEKVSGKQIKIIFSKWNRRIQQVH